MRVFHKTSPKAKPIGTTQAQLDTVKAPHTETGPHSLPNLSNLDLLTTAQ
jgi:hypothetical protein